MSVDVKKVKSLKDLSGAGFAECKSALVDSAWDVDAALDLLRTKGKDLAKKKLFAATGEGGVKLVHSGDFVYFLELSCQTDFVAKNERFIKVLSFLAEIAAKNACSSSEELLALNWEKDLSIQNYLMTEIVALGENLKMSSFLKIFVGDAVVGIYSHALSPIVSFVALEGDENVDKESLKLFAGDLAMHATAFRPEYMSVKDVPSDIIEKEKFIYAEQIKDAGKPDNIVERIISGQLDKFFEKLVLSEQMFLLNDKIKVSDVIEQKSKELGGKIKLVSFKVLSSGESEA